MFATCFLRLEIAGLKASLPVFAKLAIADFDVALRQVAKPDSLGNLGRSGGGCASARRRIGERGADHNHHHASRGEKDSTWLLSVR